MFAFLDYIVFVISKLKSQLIFIHFTATLLDCRLQQFLYVLNSLKIINMIQPQQHRTVAPYSIFLQQLLYPETPMIPSKTLVTIYHPV